MTKILEEYRGLILLVIVFVVMLNMYTNRIEQLNQVEQNQVNIAESE